MRPRVKMEIIDDTHPGPDASEHWGFVPTVMVSFTIIGDDDSDARAHLAAHLRRSLTAHRLHGSEGTRHAWTFTDGVFTMGYEWSFIEDDSPDFERAWRESNTKLNELVGALAADLRGVAGGIDL